MSSAKVKTFVLTYYFMHREVDRHAGLCLAAILEVFLTQQAYSHAKNELQMDSRFLDE